jgi:hypothetical protein
MDIKLFATEIQLINNLLNRLEYDWTCFEAEIFDDRLRCKLYHRGLPFEDSVSEYWSFYFDGEYNLYNSLEHMLEGIQEYIQNLPTGDTLKQHQLVRKMEEAARIAEELNIDADFVNPLVAIMEKLANNAITHRK